MQHWVYSFLLFLLEPRECSSKGRENTNCMFCNIWVLSQCAALKIINYFVLESSPSSSSGTGGWSYSSLFSVAQLHKCSEPQNPIGFYFKQSSFRHFHLETHSMKVLICMGTGWHHHCLLNYRVHSRMSIVKCNRLSGVAFTSYLPCMVLLLFEAGSH